MEVVVYNGLGCNWSMVNNLMERLGLCLDGLDEEIIDSIKNAVRQL